MTETHTGVFGKEHTTQVKQGPMGGTRVTDQTVGRHGQVNTTSVKQGPMGGTTVTQSHHGVFGGNQV